MPEARPRRAGSRVLVIGGGPGGHGRRPSAAGRAGADVDAGGGRPGAGRSVTPSPAARPLTVRRAARTCADWSACPESCRVEDRLDTAFDRRRRSRQGRGRSRDRREGRASHEPPAPERPRRNRRGRCLGRDRRPRGGGRPRARGRLGRGLDRPRRGRDAGGGGRASGSRSRRRSWARRAPVPARLLPGAARAARGHDPAPPRARRGRRRRGPALALDARDRAVARRGADARDALGREPVDDPRPTSSASAASPARRWGIAAVRARSRRRSSRAPPPASSHR